MRNGWRYALKPLPVDSVAKKLAATMMLRKQTEGFRQERGTSSDVEISAEERMRRIVCGLRARVTEPELQQGCGPDEDPSRRN